MLIAVYTNSFKKDDNYLYKINSDFVDYKHEKIRIFFFEIFCSSKIKNKKKNYLKKRICYFL